MINVILVDDEFAALEELADKLSRIGGISVTGKYRSPLEALERIRADPPDAAFIDIEMRELDGFSLAREILRLNVKMDIVFATAFDEYALKAFDVNAVDYVVKPLSGDRLKLTVKKLAERHSSADIQSLNTLNAFIQEQLFKKSVKKVPVWKANTILLLNPDEIFYFTTGCGVVETVSAAGRFESRESLNFWGDRLKDQRFFRCHKNFLINLDKVKQAIPHFNYTYLLKFENLKDEVPVSRNYLKEFKQLILL